MIRKQIVVGTLGAILAVVLLATNRPAFTDPTLWDVGRSGLSVAVIYLCAAVYMEFVAPYFGDEFPMWVILLFLAIGSGFSFMYSGVIIKEWSVLGMHFAGTQFVAYSGLIAWIYLSLHPPKMRRWK